MFLRSEDGPEVTIGVATPQNEFKYFLCNELLAQTFCYETLDKVELIEIPKTQFPEELRPEVKLIEKEGVNLMSSHLRQMLFHDSHQRVVSALLTLSHQVGIQTQNKIKFPTRITHDLIASMAGVARETASRSLNTLRQGHLIDGSQKQFKILDIKELQKQ